MSKLSWTYAPPISRLRIANPQFFGLLLGRSPQRELPSQMAYPEDAWKLATSSETSLTVKPLTAGRLNSNWPIFSLCPLISQLRGNSSVTPRPAPSPLRSKTLRLRLVWSISSPFDHRERQSHCMFKWLFILSIQSWCPTKGVHEAILFPSVTPYFSQITVPGVCYGNFFWTKSWGHILNRIPHDQVQLR